MTESKEPVLVLISGTAPPPHLSAPQLVADLDVGQDHETQRSQIRHDEEAGVIHLGVDLG